MSRAKKEDIKKLFDYTKEEIIVALGRMYGSDLIVTELLGRLERGAIEKALDASDKASNARIDAAIAFQKWQSDMCVKYGNGRNVKLVDIPPEEIERGARLEKAFFEATKKAERLDAKANKLLGVKF